MFAARAALMTAGAAAPKGSVYFNGSARLSIADAAPLNIGSTGVPNFYTIECWFYPTTTGIMVFYYKGDGTTGTTHAFITGTNSNNLQFNGGSAISGSTQWTTNTWNHAAVSVDYGAGQTKLYLNGVQQGSTMTYNNYNNTSPLTIGDRYASHPFGNYPFTGYISNFRIVKSGSAVYSSNFTPPTTPLTAISGTTLLTCQNPTTIVDNGPNAYTITNTSATASSLSPF